MKKILFLTSMAFILFASSCKNESSTTTTEPSKNEASMREAYKAMETGDVSKIDSILTPDCVDHNGGPMGKEMKGRDAIKGMFTAMHNSMPDTKVNIEGMAEENGYVFAWIHMTGTTSATPDPSLGMPANMKMDMKMVDVVKFNTEGKATDHWGYMDPNDMMKMMPPGNMPPPASGTMTDTTKGKMGKMADTTKK